MKIIAFITLFSSNIVLGQTAVSINPVNTSLVSTYTSGPVLGVNNLSSANSASAILGETYSTIFGGGVKGYASATAPTGETYGVYGENLSLNAYGYGVYGTGFTGVGGISANGIGVFGSSTNYNGIRGISTNNTGVYGSSTSGNGVQGNSSSGTGGYFSSTNSYALITGTGKLGFGTSTPTNSFMVVNGKVGASHAIFGENTSGVSIESAYPGISFNGYYNAGRKAIVNGFVGGIAMDPSNGSIVIYSTASTGTAGNNTSPIDRITILNNGNTTIAGTVTASCGLLVCSDLRYKKNIIPLENSLANVLKINGVSYDFRQTEFPEKNFSDKNQIGLIAQEIEKIFPEMVFTDEKGFKSVDYARLTPVLVEAIKELTAKNGKLESRLDKIETLLSK